MAQDNNVVVIMMKGKMHAEEECSFCTICDALHLIADEVRSSKRGENSKRFFWLRWS